MLIKKKTTIYDVAKEAGVSRQTVSRVLNHRPDVSRETRTRIEQIIEKLDYHPSAIARSLSSHKSHTLGVVTAGLKYIGPSRTLSGITRSAEELDYGLLLKELASFDANNIYPLLKRFRAYRVDGIIWAAPEIGDNRNWLQDLLSDIDIPIIFLTMEKREGVSIVNVDNYLGGRLATEHLINLGRRNIGHVSGPLDWWESRQRKKAWEGALSNAGLPFEERMYAEGNWSSKSGKLAFDELLNRFPEMDAVFVGNDQMALSVLQSSAQRGIKVPDDLAVIGFDGLQESEFYSPSLSTVYQNQDELGRTAVQELIQIVDEKLQGDKEIQPNQILLKPELIVRESTQTQ